MKWALIIILGIMIVIAFTNLKIRLEYIREQKDDVVILEGSMWFGIVRVKYKIPMLKLQSVIQGVHVKKQATTANDSVGLQRKRFRITPHDVSVYMQKLYELRLRVHDLNKIVKQALSKFHCDQFEWRTRVGIGDAAGTGTLTGLVWGVKTSMIAVFSHYVRLSTEPKINVIPAFQNTTIDTHFRCVLRFRIGNAMIAGIKLILNLRSLRVKKLQRTFFGLSKVR